MAVVTRQLYGGAITCNVPQRFVDASELRAVPDNQEVFVDMSGDESAIIELLSMDASVPDMEAPVHYFNDLATHNDACSSAIAEVISPASTSLLPFIPAQNFCGVVVGHQVISKFKEKACALEGYCFILTKNSCWQPSVDFLVFSATESCSD